MIDMCENNNNDHGNDNVMYNKLYYKYHSKLLRNLQFTFCIETYRNIYNSLSICIYLK